MVFWSSFSKKIKQAVSQVSFDALKRRVETIESDYATKTYADQQNQAQDTKINNNTSNITQLQTTTSQQTQLINTNKSNISTNTNSINTLDTKVDGVISGLQNGNIVNYAGEYNSSTNYKLAQAVTLSGEWFVSKQNNNQGHTPTKTNNQYWVYISAPTVDLTTYLTKTEANNTYLLKTMLNTMFPVGSIVMTVDNTIHALFTMFPGKLQELTDSDLSYLAIGSGSVGTSNIGTFTIQQNNLPNIYWAWNVDWNNGITSNETNLQTYAHGGSARMDISNTKQTNYKNSTAASTTSGVRLSILTKLYLNGNVAPIPIQYTMKPKTLKIRMWKVISNLV